MNKENKIQIKATKEQIDSFGVFRLRGARYKGIPRAIDFTNPPYDFPKMWLINQFKHPLFKVILNPLITSIKRQMKMCAKAHQNHYL